VYEVYYNPPDTDLLYQMQRHEHSPQDEQGANRIVMRNQDNDDLTRDIHHYKTQQGQNVQKIPENLATIRKGKRML